MIRRAGGTPRELRSQPPDWRIDGDMLRSAIGPRTRAILLNNPHNPTGRLFDADELEVIAASPGNMTSSSSATRCGSTSCWTGDRSRRWLSLPGMAERTIKIGSAGKIFSLTGWKVGWIVAAPSLAGVVARAHQFLTFSTPPNLQSAVAYRAPGGRRLARADAPALHPRARPNVVRAAGRRLQCPCTPLRPTFCASILRHRGRSRRRELRVAAVEKAGVAVVPLSAFAEDDPSRHFVRLCFGKKDETIDAGVAAMARAKEMFA